MVVRDHVGPPPAGDDRDAEELGKPREVGRCPGAEDAASGEDHRPLRPGDEMEHRADVLRLGPKGRGPRRVELGLGRQLLVEDVLGDGQIGRTGSPTEGRPDGIADHPGHVRHGRELDRMRREPADRRRLVDLLEGLAAAERPVDLADERKHRRGVLAGSVDPDREVGGAHAAGPDRSGRAARQLAVRLGHERGGTLVARGDDPDPGGLEPFEQAEEALARDGEGIPDAGGAQGVGDEPTDGSRPGGLVRCRRFDRWLVSGRRGRLGRLGGRRLIDDRGRNGIHDLAVGRLGDGLILTCRRRFVDRHVLGGRRRLLGHDRLRRRPFDRRIPGDDLVSDGLRRRPVDAVPFVARVCRQIRSLVDHQRTAGLPAMATTMPSATTTATMIIRIAGHHRRSTGSSRTGAARAAPRAHAAARSPSGARRGSCRTPARRRPGSAASPSGTPRGSAC